MPGEAGSFHPNVQTGYRVNHSSYLVGGGYLWELAASVSVVPSLRMHEMMWSLPSSTSLPALYLTVIIGNVVGIM
jgi:hypothetical protein